jgi:hypothetical protein
MFELYDVDCDGISYVAEAYDNIHIAKEMLEDALSHAKTIEEASRIEMFLTQVYDELNFI